ncbi:hypothetical protein AADEFJLK_02780 [Methylovulum psychrotolerans]|uniref:Uncharacterized protein n=1 Tax=Methylovulum psychrotolerans TaxID=1704499 RepID=A0A2S5CKR5_9GAMM|nr:hypothetical protein AADEFJLK_02780 [Methylovulum psychrotolerans]
MPMVAEVFPNPFVLVFAHKFADNLHRNGFAVTQFGREAPLPQRVGGHFFIAIAYATIHINDEIFDGHDGFSGKVVRLT